MRAKMARWPAWPEGDGESEDTELQTADGNGVTCLLRLSGQESLKGTSEGVWEQMCPRQGRLEVAQQV